MAGIKGKSRKIPIEDIEKLAQIGCTQREMAAFFGCDTNTLERRLALPKYRAALKSGDCNLNISLRRKQVEMALKGDRTMLIWLGKQRLGQADKVIHAGSTADAITQGAVSAAELLASRIDSIAERATTPADSKLIN